MSPDLEAFLLSFACGAAALLLWDALHGLRHTFVRGIIGNIILDIAWWFAAVSAFLWCIWETVALRLRFFEAFAAALGALLYHIILSSLLRRFFCGAFDIILKIIQFIFKILLTPALFLDKILIEPLVKSIRLKRG